MDKRIPDAAIRRAWLDDNLTSAEAGAQVGLSRCRIWVRAKALGLPARRSGPRFIVPPEEMRTLWLANVRVTEIAAFYAFSPTSVRQTARILDLPGRPKGKHSPISLADYRLSLVRRANIPGERLTEAEKTLLQKLRPQ